MKFTEAKLEKSLSEYFSVTEINKISNEK